MTLNKSRYEGIGDFLSTVCLRLNGAIPDSYHIAMVITQIS